MLARILNYRDCGIILHLAREKENIQYNDVKESFYPDFSEEVECKQVKFQDVKKQLQCLQLFYAMLYPARLKVTTRGQT